MSSGDPDTSRTKSARELAVLVLIAVAIGIIALLALYIGAYFVTGSRTVGGPKEFQGYTYQWQAKLFEPAVRFESFVSSTFAF